MLIYNRLCFKLHLYPSLPERISDQDICSKTVPGYDYDLVYEFLLLLISFYVRNCGHHRRNPTKLCGNPNMCTILYMYELYMYELVGG